MSNDLRVLKIAANHIASTLESEVAAIDEIYYESRNILHIRTLQNFRKNKQCASVYQDICDKQVANSMKLVPHLRRLIQMCDTLPPPQLVEKIWLAVDNACTLPIWCMDTYLDLQGVKNSNYEDGDKCLQIVQEAKAQIQQAVYPLATELFDKLEIAPHLRSVR